jgi:hypothetical protein
MNLDNYHIKQAHSAIDDLAKELERAKKELEDHKIAVCGKIQLVTDYPIGNVMASVSSYRSPAAARKEIEALYQKCLSLKDANQAAVKNNEAVYNGLRALIATIGIPSSYNKIVNRRSFKTESVTYNWVDGLRSLIPMHDGWPEVQRVYEQKIKDVATWEKQIAAREEEEKRAAELEAKNIERMKIVGVLANKYDLLITADEHAVLDAILAKDKYLALGHSLLLNRSDWSEGPDHAEAGLDKFTVESDLDIKIHDELRGLIDDWSGDGRVFRDCEYSYDELFSMVDAALLADYRTIWEGMDI